jgi:beta-glucosidase
VLEPGEFVLSVGASSRDLRLTATVEVDGPPVRPPLGPMATLAEWLADPAGSVLVREEVGTDDAGRPRGILGDEELLALIGNFPISALAAFPGFGLDHGTVERLLQRLAAS